MTTPYTAEKAAELARKLRAVADWINQFPVPTTGATKNMGIVLEVAEAIEKESDQISAASILKEIVRIADTHPFCSIGYVIEYSVPAAREYAALSQQAAPGVSGEDDFTKALRRAHKAAGEAGYTKVQQMATEALVVQPHPTGDTQQEAIAVFTVHSDARRCNLVRRPASSKLPNGEYDLFTHPPAATALAQQVKDKAVEIGKSLLVHVPIDDSSEWNNAIEALLERITAIPIPSPTSIGLAYESAALKRAISSLPEVKRHTVNTSVVDMCEAAIRALIIPEGETALEEQKRRAAYDALINAAGVFPVVLRKMWSGGDVVEWICHEADRYSQALNQHSQKD